MKGDATLSGEVLNLPLDFELERADRATRRLGVWLAVFVAGAIGIMAVAPVSEIAAAPGEIAPSDDIVELRHVDGGDVLALHVAPGDVVAQGAPLLALRGAQLEAERRRLETRRARLALRRARLLALTEDRTPDFDVAAALEEGVVEEGAVETERALWRSERDAYRRQVVSLEARVSQRRAEAEARRAEAVDLDAEIAAHAERLAMRETLRARGVTSLADVLDTRVRAAEARARRAAALGAAQSAEAAAVEAESELARVAAEARNAWAREQIETTTQIAELDEQIGQLRDRLSRLVLRAPISGRVLDLGGLTIGGVLAPGGLAARVVPTDATMVAEVRIAPQDVGHIEEGDAALVLITTFDRERDGEWRGEVRTISPAAFVSEDGSRHFRAELSLSHEGGRTGQAPALTPGMVVQADILTGEKSILSYLLAPIFRAAEQAFSER